MPPAKQGEPKVATEAPAAASAPKNQEKAAAEAPAVQETPKPGKAEPPKITVEETLYRYYLTHLGGVHATMPDGSPAWTPAARQLFNELVANYSAKFAQA